MRVLFSNPPWWVGRERDCHNWTAGVRAGSRWPFTMEVRSSPDHLVGGEYVPYPFFLGAAASYAHEHLDRATWKGDAGEYCSVSFRDSIALREGYGTWFDYLRRLQPDYIVIESATPSWEHDSQILRSLAGGGVMPDTKVIVTGPIATAKGAEILAAHPNVIACVKGEYEKGVVRVLTGERGVIEHDLLTPAEMNAAPPPWLDETHARLYFDSNPRGQKFPQLQAWSSRGCWAKCCFCSWPGTMTGNDPDGTGKRLVRSYTADYLYPYLRDAIDRYGYRCVYFDDDLFNTSDRHVEEVCGVMDGLGVPWSAMCRADTIHGDTWQLMKDSGCFGVKIGMESGSQRVLDEIVNKRLDLTEAVDTLALLRRLGMTVHTTWMVGLPGETPDEQKKTFGLIERLYADRLHTTHQISGAAALEGTPLYQIGMGSRLAKYPGAVPDASYVNESDGLVKLGRMARGE